jgi:hypothetical protein
MSLKKAATRDSHFIACTSSQEVGDAPHEEDDGEGEDEALGLLLVVEEAGDDVVEPLEAGGLLDDAAVHVRDLRPRGEEGEDLLVLGAVGDQDDLVGAHRVKHLLQFGRDLAVRLQAQLLVAGDGGDLDLVAPLEVGELGVVEVDGREERVRVRVLRVRKPQGHGGLDVAAAPDDGGRDVPLLPEVVVAVHAEDQGLQRPRDLLVDYKGVMARSLGRR